MCIIHWFLDCIWIHSTRVYLTVAFIQWSGKMPPPSLFNAFSSFSLQIHWGRKNPFLLYFSLPSLISLLFSEKFQRKGLDRDLQTCYKAAYQFRKRAIYDPLYIRELLISFIDPPYNNHCKSRVLRKKRSRRDNCISFFKHPFSFDWTLKKSSLFSKSHT